MKKTVLNLLAIASVLTTISFLLDRDVVEISTTMRFVEYIFMLAIFFYNYFRILFWNKSCNKTITDC